MRKILFISDTPDWAIARNVDAIQKLLSWKYDIDKAYFVESFHVKDARGYHDVRTLDLQKYDLVIMRTMLHIPDDVLALIGKLDKRKVVATIAAHHCFNDERFIPIFDSRVDLFSSVFCVSDGIYEAAKKRFSGTSGTNHDVYFTPQGTEISAFYNKRSGKNDKFTIGWAGNARHGHPRDHKRFYGIIYPVICCLRDKYEFRITGRCFRPDILEHLNRIGIETTETPYHEMIDFYNSVDLYLQASESEAVASTTVEAIACGTPVISTDVGHASNLIIDGINGKIVEPTVKEFVAAIEKFQRSADYERVFKTNTFVRENILDWKNLVSFTDIAIQKSLEVSP